jgi:hypothetical protein
MTMPYTLYLGLLYRLYTGKYFSIEAPTLKLSVWKKILRFIIFGASLATAYLPYLIFMGVDDIYEAMLLTVVAPLSIICFIGTAYLEDIYIYLGISFYKAKSN